MRALSKFLESLRHILEVLFSSARGPPRTHVGLLVIGAELLAETDHSEMPAAWIFKVSVAPAPTAHVAHTPTLRTSGIDHGRNFQRRKAPVP